MRLVVGTLVGIAVLLSVLTVLYWRHTRPDLLDDVLPASEAGRDGDGEGDDGGEGDDRGGGEDGDGGGDGGGGGDGTPPAPADEAVFAPPAGEAPVPAQAQGVRVLGPVSPADDAPSGTDPDIESPEEPQLGAVLDPDPLHIVTLEDIEARGDEDPGD